MMLFAQTLSATGESLRRSQATTVAMAAGLMTVLLAILSRVVTGSALLALSATSRATVVETTVAGS